MKSVQIQFFLDCTFPHSDWVLGDTPYLSVFIPNAGKYGQEKTPYLDTSHAILFRFSNVSDYKVSLVLICCWIKWKKWKESYNLLLWKKSFKAIMKWVLLIIEWAKFRMSRAIVPSCLRASKVFPVGISRVQKSFSCGHFLKQ